MSVLSEGTDFDRAMAIAAVIGEVGLLGEERLHMITIPGNPPTKARARTTRSGHVYHDPKAVQAERSTARVIRESIAGRLFTGNVAIGCIFFRADMYRQDVDNMLKHVCDAANKVAWKDDCQVTAIMGLVEYDPVNPRTVVVLTSHASTLRRGTDDVRPCKGCGNPVERRARRVYCSDECARRVPRGTLAVPVDCVVCQQPFRRHTTSQKYCSTECRTAGRRGQQRPSKAVRSNCKRCGKRLAHSRGGRCRECWRLNPRGGSHAHP